MLKKNLRKDWKKNDQKKSSSKDILLFIHLKNDACCQTKRCRKIAHRHEDNRCDGFMEIIFRLQASKAVRANKEDKVSLH